jgi:glycerol-3-phosphate dehydrogenase
MILERYIEEHNGDNFDLIIIGGGITGAAVAYVAATYGFSVALFEKNDYGSGASAATSKLIHGGLRYLANLEIRLVRESLAERKILSNIAPNFVYPQPFIIPNYKNRKRNTCKIIAGMYLYDRLAYDKRKTWDKCKQLSNHKIIKYSQTIKLEPNIKKENLWNSTYFYDCQNIFPERLTLSFIKSAVNHGARVSNYSAVEGFKYSKDSIITGVIVRDCISNKLKDFNANLIINCSGNFTDEILGLASKKATSSNKIKLSEGIHIITEKIAGDHVVSLQKEDGCHLIIMPWRGHSLIGTTDKEYLGSPADYHVSKESLYEMISAVNENFDRKITISDIRFAYGGLRTLVKDQEKNSYTTSRKYEIYDNEVDGINGMITAIGGKFTTSRSLAEELIKIVAEKSGKKLPDSVSGRKFLSGCEIKDLKQFISVQHLKYSDFSAQTIEYLSRNYGTESDIVFQIARDDARFTEVINQDGEILAEVVYAVRYESAKRLEDIMLRRTGIGTLGNPGHEVIRKIADIAAEMLNWDSERVEKEIISMEKVYDFIRPENQIRNPLV